MGVSLLLRRNPHGGDPKIIFFLTDNQNPLFFENTVRQPRPSKQLQPYYSYYDSPHVCPSYFIAWNGRNFDGFYTDPRVSRVLGGFFSCLAWNECVLFMRARAICSKYVKARQESRYWDTPSKELNTQTGQPNCTANHISTPDKEGICPAKSKKQTRMYFSTAVYFT